MIRGVGGPPAPAAGASRRRGAAGGFHLPEAAGGAAAKGVAPAMAVGLSAMLALQEMPDPAVGDREAHRHGREMLEELAALQRELLAGVGANPGPADRRRLARLAGTVPQAADPGLREAVAAIALRARLELARLEVAGA